jgi:thioester reductase-like protein
MIKEGKASKNKMHKEKTIFITGATGLLGSYLLKILLQNGHKVYVLARPIAGKNARDRVTDILRFWDYKGSTDKLIVLEGDVTKQDLGLSFQDTKLLKNDIEEIYHSAAITDLNSPLEEIRKANVEGTRNILELSRTMTEKGRLLKVNHLSTAFVYGDYTGVFKEQNLDVGQKFETNYEESKFLAEKVVEEYRKKDLWVDVYRPSIVVGESKAGKTFQFKHIYQFIHLLCLEIFDTLPILGIKTSLVPVDILSQAIYAISQRAKEKNKNYHPFPQEPVSIEHLVTCAAKTFGFRKPKMVSLEGYPFRKLTPAQRAILRNSILAVNFRIKFDATYTNTLLQNLKFLIAPLDDIFLKNMLKYFLEHRQNSALIQA